MRDALRAEFPGAAGWVGRLRKPTVAREPIRWAFLSAAGAGFILGGVVGLVLFTVGPIILPATEPRPSWLNSSVVTQTAASIAVGAVALRSGGLATLALYVLYELALILAAFPGRQYACTQFAARDPSRPFSCDLPGVIVDQWPTWLALTLGAIGSRWLPRPGDEGANRLLRGAGVYAVVLTVASTLYGVLIYATLSFTESFSIVSAGIYVLGTILAGVLAGLVLRRAPVAARVLVAVLILSSLALALPMAINNGRPTMPWEMALIQWSGVAASVLGAAGLLVGGQLASRDRDADPSSSRGSP